MGSSSEGIDAALLSACRHGDRRAFGAFYARHREGVVAYLMRRVGDPEIAADLMAETFARALVAVLEGQSQLPETPVAWLYTIARNLVIDSARRGQVDAAARRRLQMEPLELDDDDLERVTEIAAATEAVESAASSLSESDWEMLRARVIDDEGYGVLASRLRCSEAVVRKRVSRAKASLRAALGGRDV
jgi:RNA polymerase sigma-70 factor (ECF subfamily)